MRLTVSRARRPAPLRCGAAPTVSAPLLVGPVMALGGAVTGGRAVDGGAGGGGAGLVGLVSGAAGVATAGLGAAGVGPADPGPPDAPGPEPPGVGDVYGGPSGELAAVTGREAPGCEAPGCEAESGQPTGAGSRAANPPGACRSPSALTRCPSRLVLLAFGLGIARHGHDGLLVGQVDQAHTHSLPARSANLFHPGADHAAARGDREDLLVDLDDQGTDQ